MNKALESLNPFVLPSVRLDDKNKLPKTAGLYFVLSGDRILYIGKTERSFRSRWNGWRSAGHHREQQFLAEGSNIVIACWEVKERGEDLHRLESQACELFRPELNQTPISAQFKIRQAKSRAERKPKGKKEKHVSARTLQDLLLNEEPSVFERIALQLSISKTQAMLYFPDGEVTPWYPKIPDSDRIASLIERRKFSSY